MFEKPATKYTLEPALPGRDDIVKLNATQHCVNQLSIVPSWLRGFDQALTGMGCTWGTERMFWKLRVCGPPQ